jgi:hypothetical protein
LFNCLNGVFSFKSGFYPRSSVKSLGESLGIFQLSKLKELSLSTKNCSILSTSGGKLVLELVEEGDLHILRYKRLKNSLPRPVLPSRNLTTHTLG